MSDWRTRFKHRARALSRLPWHSRLVLLETAVYLGMARGMVLLIPFKRLAPWLGRLNVETAAACDPGQQEAVSQVRWAIRKVSPFTPWKSNCLARAIAAKLMLRRRSVDSTLYLGVSKSASLLEAHAWLRAGDTVVTGDEERPAFIPVAAFGVRAR